jgi:hypothetical protein
MFFQQHLSKLYCLSLLLMLSKFEPFRLATRHEHGEGRCIDPLSQNIQLEVVQHTDTYILRAQNQSADTMKASTRDSDPDVERLSPLGI